MLYIFFEVSCTEFVLVDLRYTNARVCSYANTRSIIVYLNIGHRLN